MEDAVRLFRSTREYLTPVMTETAFYDRGMLTPEEFIKAGDQLVRTCPSWKWESGEEGKLRPYLPKDKQFLCTRGVPSYSRVSVLQSSKLVEETVAGGMGESDGDWCAPELKEGLHDQVGEDEVLIEAEDIMDVADNVKESSAAADRTPPASTNSAPIPAVSAAEDEYLDLEDESLALDDAATSSSALNNTKTAGKGPADAGLASAAIGTAASMNLVRTRRYDVSITYDNYYRVPRIWFFGFDESGSTLSTTDIYQDIMQDYAKKTVTIDPHPHLSRPHASIHPCQHAPAMLSIIAALKDSGSELPTVEQYMFIFLKFIQSVVPTIEYDYTIDVQVRGKG
mmetsp:Transcript_28620/g.48046  ORF Transcript_28620/g.48046 Transcript_28620/m.48046 type:complete len:340 (+) Transcript_28620:93-1112(+)